VEDETDAEKNDSVETVVLPDPVDPDAELSEDDLEAVAGGTITVTAALTCVAAGATLGTTAKAIADNVGE
jgi:hypothetical protein